MQFYLDAWKSKIIFAFTTMFSFTYCNDENYSVGIPALINSFTKLMTMAMSSARATEDTDLEVEDPATEKPTTGNLQGVALGVVSYMTAMLRTLSRRVNEMRPNVEMGPGAFKPEIVTYPPNYFVNRLKTLLKIKKRNEDKNKPLNKT